MDDLRLVVFPAKERKEEYSCFYDNVLSLYLEEWTSVYKELKKDQEYKHCSDDFTRQDRVLALFRGDTCVSFTFIREVDLYSPALKSDSWFKPWTKSSIEYLQKGGNTRGSVYSYFTVNKNHRKHQEDGYHFGYMQGALSSLYFADYGTDIMIGAMRNSRGMHELGKQWGSTIVKEAVLHNGEPTDLVVFEREHIREASEKFPEVVHNLHKNIHHYFEGEEYAEVA